MREEGIVKLLALAIFVTILALTLIITYWAARRTQTASAFYTADGTLGPIQNGLALAGDWMSAAAFLGFSGLAALYGMDGSLYAVGALVAFLAILMLVAEPIRNTGRFTLGDVIAFRMQRSPARLAAVLGTVVVSLAYLVPQMAGGAALIKLLLGVPYEASIFVVGLGMVIYVVFGGMIATTWVQIIKAFLLLGTAQFGFDPLAVFAATEEKYGPQMLAPGNYLRHPLDPLSLGLSFASGTAGLPHVMTHFYTVPDAQTARRSAVWLMFLAGAFFLVTTLIGFASAVLVDQDVIRAADKGGNLALPLLAQYLGGGPDSVGGQAFLAFVVAVAFATILAVVAALTLSTSGHSARSLCERAARGPCERGRTSKGGADLNDRGRRLRHSLRPDGSRHQRRRARYSGDLDRRQREFPGDRPVAVLASVQHLRRHSRHGCGTGLFRGAGAARSRLHGCRGDLPHRQSRHRQRSDRLPRSRARSPPVAP